jgi:UDP-glucose 4-epimerase
MTDNKNPLTCLVMGGNGFIGSHLVDALVDAGYKVIAYDNFSHSPKFKNNDLIQKVKGDIFNEDGVREAMENADILIHSFSKSTPFISDNNPYIDVTENLMESIKIFEKSVEKGIKKIVYISSGGAVYGNMPNNKKASENEAPHPVSPYGINKLATEYYLGYFKNKFGIDYIVYRLTNPYGERQITKNKQGVIPMFIDRINNNEELTIYGDGTSSRDYIYIKDAVDMIVQSFSKETKYTTYNIGSGIQTELTSLIEMLEKLTGRKAKIKHNPAPKTFLKSTQISIDRFTDEFGQISPVSIEDGLKRMLEN